MNPLLLVLLSWPPFLRDRDATPAEVAAVESFLRDFDEAHASGDPDEVCAFLAEGPASCRARCEEIVRGSFPGLVERKSRLLLLRVDGEAMGAFVQATLRRSAAAPAKGGIREETRRDEFLLLRITPDGLRLVRALDFDPAHLAGASANPVGCPPCNWVLERPPGWFSVPRLRSSCSATEGLALVPSGGEPTIELRVLEGPEPCDPLEATRADDERLTREGRGEAASARTLLRRALPSRAGLTGAESEAEFPLRGGARGRVLRAYFSRGPNLYTLVAFGRAEAVDRVRADFAKVRDSLRAIDPDMPEPEQRRAMLGAHHPGGALAGNAFSFEGAGLRLRIAAPEGWPGVEMTGPTLFRVLFRPEGKKERGASLDFYAFEDPAGWPSPGSIDREFESREAEIRAGGAQAFKRGDFSSAPHPGIRVALYRREAEWRDAAGKSMREVFLFAPIGNVALCVAARAGAESFESLRPLFERAVENLSRP